MTGERKDFECTPETGSAAILTHPPEPSASFECTPPTASIGVKPPQARVFGVIAEVAREVVKRVKG